MEREDDIDNIMNGAEHSDGLIDLLTMVHELLGPMPVPADIKRVVGPLAERFEIQLYVEYYLDAEKVHEATVDVDGAVRVDWSGMPDAVFARFRDTGNWDLVENHPKLRRTFRQQVASVYSGHRI